MKSTYGLATRVVATPGTCEAMTAILDEVSRLVFTVPGCVSYVVSSIPAQPDALFIIEFWRTRDDQRSAYAMAGIFEVSTRFRQMAAQVEQYELAPLGA